MIIHRGEKFSDYNKPKKFIKHKIYKYRVLAKENNIIRVVNFGDKRYKDYLQHKDKDRRDRFRKRMNCNNSYSKLTRKYWVCNYNW